MACARVISAGITIDCNPTYAGTGDNLYLFNYADIDSYTFDTANFAAGNVISAITLKSGGKQAYKFEGQFDSNVYRDFSERATFRVDFRHELDFVAFNLNPVAVTTLNDLARSRVVAVVEQNGLYRVLGRNSGLELSNISSDSSSEDLGGAYQINLVSKQEVGLIEYFGTFAGATLASYDLDASTALLEGYLTPTM